VLPAEASALTRKGVRKSISLLRRVAPFEPSYYELPNV